jgi:pimeloyl-ACP methyl ester carboxylesterase
MTADGEIVVVIHGLWMNGVEAGLLRHRLTDEHGFPTMLFSYGTFGASFTANAERLRDDLDKLDAARVHLVGHSTGGVMALHALDRRPFDKPGRVVCLGSPLRGSVAARAMAQIGGDLGAAALGMTGREALLSEFFKSWDGRQEVGVIAGTMSVGAGQLLGVLPDPNDGTVAVAETQLPGIKDHMQLPVTHTGLLVSVEVATQTAFFLRHGMFNRKSPAYQSSYPPEPA